MNGSRGKVFCTFCVTASKSKANIVKEPAPATIELDNNAVACPPQDWNTFDLSPEYMIDISAVNPEMATVSQLISSEDQTEVSYTELGNMNFDDTEPVLLNATQTCESANFDWNTVELTQYEFQLYWVKPDLWLIRSFQTVMTIGINKFVFGDFAIEKLSELVHG